MQDWTGITAYAYDPAGRQVSVANPNGKTLTYTFDPDGNRVGMIDPDGGLTTYAYDAQSRPTGILNPWAERTTITWDALDREWVKTLGNGMVHEHTYDAAGRQVLLRNLGPAGNALAAYTGTYDAEGNLLFIHELDGTRVTFAYDPLYQLVGEERSAEYAYCTSYSYDPVGNRLVKVDGGLLTTYIYNIADELLTVTLPTGEVTTSTWDANGNLASEEAEAGQTAYAWDDENRLIRITSPGGSIDTFTYAADGLRRRKEPGSTARNFVWDGLNVLQEQDASFSTMAGYTGYPGVPGGLASMRRAGASSFYGPDLLGNTGILVSPAGAVTDAYAYKAFGEELPAVGATDNPFRFGGMPGFYRSASEPVYGRSWNLDVSKGRLLSRGPAALAVGLVRSPIEVVPGVRVAPDPVPWIRPDPVPKLPVWLKPLGYGVVLVAGAYAVWDLSHYRPGHPGGFFTSTGEWYADWWFGPRPGSGRGYSAGYIDPDKRSIRGDDPLARLDLRGRSLTAGEKLLRPFRLRKVPNRSGTGWVWIDQDGQPRVRWDPAGHWHKYWVDRGGQRHPLSNSGRVVDDTSATKVHIPCK